MVAEVPSDVINSTDACPCTTDMHHERSSRATTSPAEVTSSGNGGLAWPRNQ